MNRLLKIFTLFSMVVLISSICYATDNTPQREEIAEGVYRERNTVPYIIDTLYISEKVLEGDKELKHQEKIYVSEGKEIKEVKLLDVDSDGKNEYLVSMFSGGSGGFYDFAIVKDNNGKWDTIWEGSFAQPNIEINNNDGKISLKIEHFERIGEEPKQVTSIFEYEDGKIVKR